jgi:hypothetical protein
MYVSCNLIGQDEGNILLWHMAQRVTIFFTVTLSYLSFYVQEYKYICHSSAGWLRILGSSKITEHL